MDDGSSHKIDGRGWLYHAIRMCQGFEVVSSQKIPVFGWIVEIFNNKFVACSSLSEIVQRFLP